MPQPTRKNVTPRETRSVPGRPRKLVRASIIEAAARIVGDQGFEALSMRSLALRLGINHATLYNYFENIDEIEAEALESLLAHVPIPDAAGATPMRAQLLQHLMALRELQTQHPKILHASVGSRSWHSLARLQNRVLSALAPHGQSLVQIALGYSALLSVIATSAERARRIGGDYIEIQRRAIRSQRGKDFEMMRRVFIDLSVPGSGIHSLPEILNYLIDRLLPDIDRRSREPVPPDD